MHSAEPRGPATHPADQARRSYRGQKTKRLIALGIIALAVIWLVAFISHNSETVRVSFVFGHAAMSLIWVMLICAVLGAVLALAIPRLASRRQSPR
jgi:uncharacterized integral membrane protein